MSYDDWVYFLSARGANLIIQFGKNGAVAAVECSPQGTNPSACGQVAGLWLQDTEEKVVHRLGAPTTEHLVGSAKIVDYEDIGLQIHFTDGKIYSFRIEPKKYGERGQMLRFIHTRLP